MGKKDRLFQPSRIIIDESRTACEPKRNAAIRLLGNSCCVRRRTRESLYKSVGGGRWEIRRRRRRK